MEWSDDILCNSEGTVDNNVCKALQMEIVEPITQDWTIERICNERPPPGWEEVFESSKLELKEISDILCDQEKVYGTIYPLKKDIFRAFEMTPLSHVKVVIFGQDPYHDSTSSGPRAQGLAFSVSECSNIPPSLRNIFTEIKNEYPEEFVTPQHGDLSFWAYQGVFLLNTCLTVRPGAAGSHKKLWTGLIVKVIDAINKTNPSCVYVLWGDKAKNLRPYIGGKAKILQSPHPSPLSAYRGFYGNNHFIEINRLLRESGNHPINWNLPKIFSV